MPTTKPSVLIVGTGFGGIGAAIELGKHGYDDVVILEKSDRLGGVWRENTYPGAACDIPSPLYSYSYEPNPNWSKRYSPQPEILDYMERTAAKYGVDKLIRFNTEVTSASFEDGKWQIKTNNGDFEADVFVPALGQLSRPVWPNIKGRDDFQGHTFHSAIWDHDYDLKGKRVAVIGTGASAIQFVPEIQPIVSKLSLFQRSAPWLLVQPQTEYHHRHKAIFERFPVAQRFERQTIWHFVETLQKLATTPDSKASPLIEAMGKARLKLVVKDPVLRAKLTPDYPAGCKRVLFTNKYLPAMTKPNVDLVTEDITEITATGVRTADGVEHQADVLIYGTGFKATEFLAPLSIKGVDGQDLHETWDDGARAYLGMTVPGFPNMFVMYGPNTNLGFGSIITMLEPQAAYIRQAVQLLAAGGGPLEVKPDIEQTYDTEVQGRLDGSVWTRCSSWYRTASGRISTNWVGSVKEYKERVKTLNPADFAERPTG